MTTMPALTSAIPALDVETSRETIRNVLKQCRLFRGLSEEDLDATISCMQLCGGREGTVSKAEFEKALGKPIEFILPEDAKANQAAANAGKPVAAAAGSSKVTGALKHLAKSITAVDGSKGKSQKKSFWSLSRK